MVPQIGVRIPAPELLARWAGGLVRRPQHDFSRAELLSMLTNGGLPRSAHRYERQRGRVLRDQLCLCQHRRWTVRYPKPDRRGRRLCRLSERRWPRTRATAWRAVKVFATRLPDRASLPWLTFFELRRPRRHPARDGLREVHLLGGAVVLRTRRDTAPQRRSAATEGSLRAWPTACADVGTPDARTRRDRPFCRPVHDGCLLNW